MVASRAKSWKLAPAALLAALACLLAAPLVAPAQEVDPVPAGPAAAAMPAAAELDTYLAAKGSPMAGQGAAFVTSGGVWKVDPRLLIAIAGAESGFGQITCGPFNAWGYGCPNHPFVFSSWADAIDTVTRGLRTNYLAGGRTSVALIHQKYAPIGAGNDPTGLNNNWTINVSRFLLEMGGNPDNVDMGGVAGSFPLGLETVALTPAFDFQASDTAPAPGTSTDKPTATLLSARAGEPALLELDVRNTGSTVWTPATVRLRRVDGNGRVASAPYAALRSASVAAGATAQFSVELSVAGTSGGGIETTWRLEGPGGPFGAPIQRRVRLVIDDLVAGDATIQAPAQLAAGESAVVIVKIRNAGTVGWHRDGDTPVVLGVRTASGPSLTHERWPSPKVPARLLERRVEPGAIASFAFPVTGGSGAGVSELVLLPFQGSTWAGGSPVRVRIGRS